MFSRTVTLSCKEIASIIVPTTAVKSGMKQVKSKISVLLSMRFVYLFCKFNKMNNTFLDLSQKTPYMG